MYGVRVSVDEITNMAVSTGCAAGYLPFNYLGITIRASMASKGQWDSIVQRFKDRLSRWKSGGQENANMGGVGEGYCREGNRWFGVTKMKMTFSNEDRALWCNVIKAIHREYGGSDSKEYNLVSGDKVRFWKDIWLDDQPLSTRFPRLFRLENDQIVWFGIGGLFVIGGGTGVVMLEGELSINNYNCLLKRS
ncbi:hypothetical protein CTI12_AA101590 [Artemisia annua]|uniref:Reverse transcriptase domain, Reverse transcriptase zinc-binding domain protein n=1 Tax=Artemisia annua TaxID=35608 RepID=A0A2U1PX79_ARTAN|nr:hypothetical protein CTI12_AA101590 [Artemisia annua]